MIGVHLMASEVLFESDPLLTHLPHSAARLLLLVHRVYLPSSFSSAAPAPDLVYGTALKVEYTHVNYLLYTCHVT